jgi:hypothetical protein
MWWLEEPIICLVFSRYFFPSSSFLVFFLTNCILKWTDLYCLLGVANPTKQGHDLCAACKHKLVAHGNLLSMKPEEVYVSCLRKRQVWYSCSRCNLLVTEWWQQLCSLKHISML